MTGRRVVVMGRRVVVVGGRVVVVGGRVVVVGLLVPRRRLGAVLVGWALVAGGAAQHLHAQVRGGGGEWADVTVEKREDLVAGDVAEEGAGLQTAHVELVPTLQNLGPVAGEGKEGKKRRSESADEEG
jgi:hypothetical protein